MTVPPRVKIEPSLQWQPIRMIENPLIRLGRKARIAAVSAEKGMGALSEDDVAVVTVRVRDIVVDAMLAGLDRYAIHALVDREIDRLAARRAEAERAS